MTEKDLEIQELKRRLAKVEAQVGALVKCYRLCGLCKWIDADCSPTDGECDAEWSGKFTTNFNGGNKDE